MPAGARAGRTIRLPHAVDGERDVRVPETFFLLATMNTADRSIQNMDLAVRRRFAFVAVPPSRQVVEENAPPASLAFFDRLADVFVEHAPDDALDLMPGHAYFLAKDEHELRARFAHELLPLIDGQFFYHLGGSITLSQRLRLSVSVPLLIYSQGGEGRLAEGDGRTPDSRNQLVRALLDAYGGLAGGNSAAVMFREGSTVISPGRGWVGATASHYQRYAYHHVVTGLTPNDSKTYRLGAVTNAGGPFELSYGTGFGPIVLEAWDVEVV